MRTDIDPKNLDETTRNQMKNLSQDERIAKLEKLTAELNVLGAMHRKDIDINTHEITKLKEDLNPPIKYAPPSKSLIQRILGR